MPKVLNGHTSAETAFLVNDYPYGFQLRCQVRYWLETNAKHGTRLMRQTTNPRRGGIWNKPKASTYYAVGVLLQDELNGYISMRGLSPYPSSMDTIAAFTAGIEGQLTPEVMMRIEKEERFCKQANEYWAKKIASRAPVTQEVQ